MFYITMKTTKKKEVFKKKQKKNLLPLMMLGHLTMPIQGDEILKQGVNFD